MPGGGGGPHIGSDKIVELRLIPYTKLTKKDRAFVEKHDPTPQDLFLSADDIKKLPQNIYAELMNRLEHYGSWEKPLLTAPVTIHRMTQAFRMVPQTPINEYVRQIARENQFIVMDQFFSIYPDWEKVCYTQLTPLVPTLVQEGFKILALPLSVDSQKDIDRYISKGNSSSFIPGISDGDLYPLLDACKQNGVAIVCVGQVEKESPGLECFQILKRQVLSRQPQAKVIVLTTEGLHSECVLTEDGSNRTSYLSKLTDRAIQAISPRLAPKAKPPKPPERYHLKTLGLLLEEYAPGRSHAILVIEQRLQNFAVFDEVRKNVKPGTCIPTDLPLLRSVLVDDGSDLLGPLTLGSFDSIALFPRLPEDALKDLQLQYDLFSSTRSSEDTNPPPEAIQKAKVFLDQLKQEQRDPKFTEVEAMEQVYEEIRTLALLNHAEYLLRKINEGRKAAKQAAQAKPAVTGTLAIGSAAPPLYFIASYIASALEDLKEVSKDLEQLPSTPAIQKLLQKINEQAPQKN